MGLNVGNWLGPFPEQGFPPWPCPRCGRHSLDLNEESILSAETRDSKEARDRDYYPDPEQAEERFACLLKCHHCEEVVSVLGTTRFQMVDVGKDEPEFELARDLNPLFVDPAPEIFHLPKSAPKEVADNIKRSFSLFWSDPNAAATRIRAALEFLLDAEGIQRESRRSNGKIGRLSLDRRIVEFGKQNPLIDEKMLAVKWLGNEGSHETNLRKEDLLDAFELLEYVLEEVIDKRRQRLTQKAREINKRKGKMDRPLEIPSPER